MKNKWILMPLTASMAIGSIPLATFAASCSCNPKTEEKFNIDYTDVKRENLAYLTQITDQETTIEITNFKLVDKADASDIEVSVTNLSTTDIVPVAKIIDNKNGKFNVSMNFKGTQPIIGRVVNFGLSFKSTKDTTLKLDEINDLKVVFLSTEYYLVNDLGVSQNFYTLNKEYNLLLSGAIYGYLGDTPITEFDNFYAEIRPKTTPKCTIVPSICEIDKSIGKWGVQFTISNMQGDETIDMDVVIKNKKLDNWELPQTIKLTVNNSNESCFHVEPISEGSNKCVLTEIWHTDKEIKIPEKFMCKGRECELQRININSAYTNTTTKELIIPGCVTEIFEKFSQTQWTNLKQIVIYNKTQNPIYDVREDGCLVKVSDIEKPIIKGTNSSKAPIDSQKILPGAFAGLQGLDEMDFSNNSSLKTLGEGCFANCPNLVTVKFNKNSNITAIPNNAFSGCAKLADLELPTNKITTIGNEAFVNCQVLPDTVIQLAIAKVTKIGANAFKNCLKLTSIEIPSTVTEMSYAFTGCSNLATLKVNSLNDNYTSRKPDSTDETNCIMDKKDPNNYKIIQGCNIKDFDKITDEKVTEIKEFAFNGFTGLPTDITIPVNITSIGKNAFENCPNIKSVKYLNQAFVLGENLFKNCKSLETVEWACTKVPTYCFQYCSNLKNVTLTNTKTIFDYAFQGCKSLETIALPDSLLEIKDYAFKNSGLKSLTIPRNVAALGVNIVAYTPNLEELIVSPLNQNYSSLNDDATTPQQCNAIFKLIDGVKTSVVSGTKNSNIIEGIKGIESAAFWGCSSLENIKFPESLIGIKNDAFKDCSKLLAIEIPANVTSIADGAFEGCYSLEKAVFKITSGWKDHQDKPIAEYELKDPQVAVYILLQGNKLTRTA